MVPDTSLPVPESPLSKIPDSVHLRWVIGMRYAEILVLKQLLRAAESRNRLFSATAHDHEEVERV